MAEENNHLACSDPNGQLVNSGTVETAAHTRDGSDRHWAFGPSQSTCSAMIYTEYLPYKLYIPLPSQSHRATAIHSIFPLKTKISTYIIVQSLQQQPNSAVRVISPEPLIHR